MMPFSARHGRDPVGTRCLLQSGFLSSPLRHCAGDHLLLADGWSANTKRRKHASKKIHNLDHIIYQN